MSGDINVRISASDEASGVFLSLSAEAVKFGSIVGASTVAFQKAFDFVTNATVGGIKAAINEADKLNDMSQKLGMGVQQLAAYKLAADQSGTSLETVAQGVKALSGQMLKHGEDFRKIYDHALNYDYRFLSYGDSSLLYRND